MADWHFRAKTPNETIRNPVQGEHFSDESIERPAQALVREAIQNSLDASIHPGDPVSLRFYLSGDQKALEADRARFWFGGAWQHLTADRNGLRNIPAEPRPCPFMVIEDFGTTGLAGDPSESQPPPSNRDNRFFSFFRAEGFSDKTDSKGGRWGIGKTVFPRSSAISSFFALSVRDEDGRRLLLGRTVLFYHYLDGTFFAPDGYFGDISDEGLVMPITDPDLLEQFVSDFRLARDDSASGASVVVPYVDPKIKATDVLSAVVTEYFFPILTGRLVVRVGSPDSERGSCNLDADTLMDRVARGSGVDARLSDVIRLAEWVCHSDRPALIELGSPHHARAPEWSPDLVPDDLADALAEQFKQGKRLAFRVPLTVRRIGEGKARTYFDVYLQNDLSERRGFAPVFIRNGIRIPKVRERRLRGHTIFAIVVIDDTPLASLLGDAETPAHTHWSPDTRNFKDRYKDGKAVLEFVSEAPRRLAEILSTRYEQQDRLVLADLFPRPSLPDDVAGAPEPQPEPGDQPDHPLPPRASHADPFVVDQIDGGFRIGRSSNEAKCPSVIEVTVFYDRSRGKPKYEAADFDVANMRVSSNGAEIILCDANRLHARIINSDEFSLTVVGFDANRDLYVSLPRERT